MFLYILKSLKDNSCYIGITQSLETRLAKHNGGKVFSTKPKRPWTILHTEQYNTRSEAFKREKYLKSLKSRKALEKLFTTAPSSSLV